MTTAGASIMPHLVKRSRSSAVLLLQRELLHSLDRGKEEQLSASPEARGGVEDGQHEKTTWGFPLTPLRGREVLRVA